ncbi:hypothetical protein NMY22_g14274 [Coprinellus aureogranulatus]|nr:hypothetical protein NMY22_g14274 [Coprinellus aureogranulatus]
MWCRQTISEANDTVGGNGVVLLLTRGQEDSPLHTTENSPPGSDFSPEQSRYTNFYRTPHATHTGLDEMGR